MRELDLHRNFNMRKNNAQYFGLDNSELCQVTTYDGTVFTNLKCNKTSKSKDLNKILKENNIHFIYPAGKDVSIRINGYSKSPVIFPANNMSVFFSEKYADKKLSMYSTEDLEITILSLNAELLKRFCDTFEEKLINNGYNSNLTDRESLSNTSGEERITEAINNILMFWNKDKSESPILKAAVTELQCVLLQHYLILNSENILSEVEIQKINKLPFIIASHEGGALTPEYLSLQIDMKPNRLQLGCEIVFKQKPIDLINELKLEKIASQLVTQSIQLSEVAYSNGYRKRSYFYEIFEKKFNCSPQVYRSQFKTERAS